MTNIAFLKLLKDKKVADAFQYYEACIYKLYLAQISCDALDKVINDFETGGANAVKQVFQDALRTGTGSYKPMRETVDFCGIEIPISTATTKLTMEVMSLLHNFFDVFAQWINSSLFAENALPIGRVSLTRVIQELCNYPEYNGQFITDLIDVPNKDIYKYIADFNNILKHRSQIHVSNKINMFTAEGSVAIPDFSKDGRPHPQQEVIDAVHAGFDFCEKLLTDSTLFIESFYTGNDNNYTEHRFYNPKQFLMIESQEDYENKRNPKNHYAYIEVDPACILSEYDIMIALDSTDKEDGRVDLYNSPYSIIMLREKSTSNIVGILKPDDNESLKARDEHPIEYRKYLPITAGYEIEMFKAVCEGEYKFYPLLGDYEINILTEEEINAAGETSDGSVDISADEQGQDKTF